MAEQEFYHRDLASGKWAQMSIIEQMANIGSEIHRTSLWMKRGQENRMQLAFYRTLELIDLSIMTQTRPAALKELCYLREHFCGIVLNKDIAQLSSLDKSFDAWGLAYSRLRQ